MPKIKRLNFKGLILSLRQLMCRHNFIEVDAIPDIDCGGVVQISSSPIDLVCQKCGLRKKPDA